ncbi:hypothetical protein GOODEAATRI_018569 [Goodea atripinnis]|uniref:Uncharacterized protein n=1 Tax=Goodea atripinnis TaxID=208336 RepID=A0ABV0NLB9_9TELE
MPPSPTRLPSISPPPLRSPLLRGTMRICWCSVVSLLTQSVEPPGPQPGRSIRESRLVGLQEIRQAEHIQAAGWSSGVLTHIALMCTSLPIMVTTAFNEFAGLCKATQTIASSPLLAVPFAETRLATRLGMEPLYTR